MNRKKIEEKASAIRNYPKVKDESRGRPRIGGKGMGIRMNQKRNTSTN